MRLLFSTLREVKDEEEKILRTINNVNFKSIPVKLAGRVVHEISCLLRVFDDKNTCITERRLKLELAGGLTETIVALQWQCVEQTFQNAVLNVVHAVLCRQIALRKKKRYALQARRESYFKKKADRKIVNKYQKVFADNSEVEEGLLDREDNISVLRALGRPSTGFPFDDTGLMPFENLAPPLMSTSLVPAPREYNDITYNLPAELRQTEVVINYTIGEPSAILGIQPPDELLSFVEDLPAIPAAHSVPEPITSETRKVKEEYIVSNVENGIGDKIHSHETPVAAEITPVEQPAEVIENEAANVVIPISPLQSITGFVDVTIEEMRQPYLHRAGDRGLLADVVEINPVNDGLNVNQTVIPESPDSDIHQLLEPLMLPQASRKKGKLIVDEQTKILDYSARAVKLANQPHSYQNLFEKTNFNLKRLKLTMSAARLFKTPACSSLFSPIRGSELTKIYERHLTTDEKPANPIERVSDGVPIVRDSFNKNNIVSNVPTRQDNAEINLTINGEDPTSFLRNINQGDALGNERESAQQKTLNKQPEPTGECLNIIMATTITDEKQDAPQEKGHEMEILGNPLVATPARDGANDNPRILRDSLDSAAPINRENLVDNLQQSAQHEASMVVNGNCLTDVIPELVVQQNPVQNVILNEIEEHNLTVKVHASIDQDAIIEKQLEQIFLSDKGANNIPPPAAQDCHMPVISEVMQQQTFSEIQPQAPYNLPTINTEPPQEVISPSKTPRDKIRVIPIARLQVDATNVRQVNELSANKEYAIPDITESGGEIAMRPIFQTRGHPPRKDYRSSQYVMGILMQNWELVNIITISDILGTEHTLNDEVILTKTLLRLNKQWVVQLNKIYDTLAISPFPENGREFCMSF